MKRFIMGLLSAVCSLLIACEDVVPFQPADAANTSEVTSEDSEGTTSSSFSVSAPIIRIEDHTVTIDGKNVIKIESSLHGSEIYYTLDSSLPSSTNGLIYTDPGILVNATTTVRAIAVKDGQISSIVSKTFSKIVFLDFHVNDSTIEINSTYPNIYYAENSTETNPRNMTKYLTEFIPSEKSVSGIPYTVVTGKDGFINATYQETVFTAKAPYVVEQYLVSGTLITVRLVSNAPYARFTMDGTDPSNTAGSLFSGNKVISYPYYYLPHPVIKMIGIETGKLCSDIIQYN